MKGYRSIISLLLMLVVVFSAAVVSVSADSTYMRGDADADGVVTVLDATTIQRKLVQLPTPSFNEKAADVDGDGLNITDATKIQRYLAEFENIYHINETVIVPDPTEPQPTAPQPTTPQPTRDPYELPVVPRK